VSLYARDSKERGSVIPESALIQSLYASEIPPSFFFFTIAVSLTTAIPRNTSTFAKLL